jgi:HPt (histidine-containing phosphotransfer) domain-containing protein
MAFKTAIRATAAAAAGRPAPGGLPLDLDHLDRQTLGDRQLQVDVLRLFLRHADEQVDRLWSAASGEARREAAHSLAGSAKGVGAFAVAAAAAEIENAKGPVTGRLHALEAAMAAARVSIEDFMAR